MKKYFLTLISCACISFLHGQSNEWTWMGGESNYSGFSYGSKGVADSSNLPGIRSSAARWKDSAGNFWLFGGSGRNDLWKYDLLTKYWTWVSGDSIAIKKAVYGTKGMASSATNRVHGMGASAGRTVPGTSGCTPTYYGSTNPTPVNGPG